MKVINLILFNCDTYPILYDILYDNLYNSEKS